MSDAFQLLPANFWPGKLTIGSDFFHSADVQEKSVIEGGCKEIWNKLEKKS